MRLCNRQRRKLPLRRLKRQTELAVSALEKKLPPRLREVNVVMVSEAESARVHAEFLNDPTPTDVITFADGELIICPAVADRQRHVEGLSLSAEVLTYIIHGLLHLCGYDDHTEKDFHAMRRKQTQIRNKVLPVPY
ncbi:MAG: rRNA maturation RNase YbeY [Verrucomicrobiales bacterium]|nr:rRNA maturation RNase YbeY [Verrucomicrobiales bacterium]